MKRLTFVQTHALATIADGARPVRDVSDSLRVPLSTARTALDALERRGLAQRQHTGVAGRVIHYRITAAGAALNADLWDDEGDET